MTIPSPSFMHFFQGGRCADQSVYPDPEGFWEDLLRIYEDEIAALGSLGVNALQIDEVPQAMLCDPSIRNKLAHSAKTRTALQPSISPP